MGQDGSEQVETVVKTPVLIFVSEMSFVWYCLLNMGDFMLKTIPTYTKYAFCARPGVKRFHITDSLSIDSKIYCPKAFIAWRGTLSTTYLSTDAQFINFWDFLKQ